MAMAMETDSSRPDGRSPNQVRPLACARGILHRAHGSARWSQDNTIVLAAVYGPKAASGRKENAERAILDVTWKPKTGQSACAALVDAGIPLKNTLAAVCCGVTEGGEVILDPTKLEELKVQAYVSLVFPNHPLSVMPEGPPTIDSEPLEHGIISCITRGAMSVDDYLDCLERGRAASSRISEFVRKSLEQSQR